MSKTTFFKLKLFLILFLNIALFLSLKSEPIQAYEGKEAGAKRKGLVIEPLSKYNYPRLFNSYQKFKRLISDHKFELPAAFATEAVVDLEKTHVSVSNEVLFDQDWGPTIEYYFDIKEGILYFIKKSDRTTLGRERLNIKGYFNKKNEVRKVKRSMIASITTLFPKTVTLFKTALVDYDERDLLVLYAHEQAHRLSFFKDYNQNEIFIEEWSRTFVSFLEDEISDVEFKNWLESHRLDYRTAKTIKKLTPTGVTKYEGYDTIYVDEEITIFPDDVIAVGEYNKQYYLQLKPRFVEGYPYLYFKDSLLIKLSKAIVRDIDTFNDIANFRDALLSNRIGTKLTIRFFFRNNSSVDSNGYLVISNRAIGVELSASSKTKLMTDIMATNLKQYFNYTDVKIDNSLFFQSIPLDKILQQTYNSLSVVLNGINRDFDELGELNQLLGRIKVLFVYGESSSNVFKITKVNELAHIFWRWEIIFNVNSKSADYPINVRNMKILMLDFMSSTIECEQYGRCSDKDRNSNSAIIMHRDYLPYLKTLKRDSNSF